jgi:predicted RNA-binding Zn-ribbon protein involved in translation (DUF1610 family)
MPYIALHNGKKVVPVQVPKDITVTCPECGGEMRVRGPFSDGRGRHFWHTDNLGGGGGGGSCESVAESDKHKKWKSLAADRLKYLFDENCRSLRVEMQLEAPVSNKDYRQADAIILFEDRDEQLGQGVVVEVQHKNESKDISAAERDYLDQDLAVVWSEEEDFGQHRMRLEQVDIRHRAETVAWPDHAPRIQDWPTRPTGKHFLNSLAGKLIADPTEDDELVCPATLPAEYLDEQAQRFWSERDWETLVAGPRADEYIDEVAESGVAGPVSFDMSDLSSTVPRRFWKKYRDYFLGWFETHRRSVAQGLKADPRSVVIPVTFPPDTTERIEYLSSQLAEDTEVATCPHCGSTEIRELYGERQLSTTCRVCGDWFVFHRYGQTNPINDVKQ